MSSLFCETQCLVFESNHGTEKSLEIAIRVSRSVLSNQYSNSHCTMRKRKAVDVIC